MRGGGDQQRSAVRPRLVALGASNLARGGMLALLDAARAASSGPIEAFAALGRGRSYGIPSSLLGRRLGGIDDCGLWDAIAAAPSAPTTAMLMDVGNDLMYGVEVSRVLEWVDRALRRLAGVAQRRIVVGLPMAMLRNLGHWRYVLVRSILSPGCDLSLRDMLDRAEATHLGLGDLARNHGATFHELPASWHRFDPVHIRQKFWPAAARTFLDLPAGQPAPRPRTNGALARLRFLGDAPAVSAWFGRPRHGPMPTRRWRDGTTLSLW